MDRRRTVTLLIISVITLIVTITGASYAYFAASNAVNRTVPIDAQTAPAAPSFMSTSSGSIDIDVEAYLMKQEEADDNETRNELTDTATLSVYLSSSNNKVVSTCTYDIIFVWDESADIYEKTFGANKEFTITASAKTNNGKNATTSGIKETNIDELTWQTKTITENGQTKEIRYAVLVDDATISSAYLRKPTAVDWQFTVKFYNITKNQEQLKSKKYGGMIRVDSESIKC